MPVNFNDPIHGRIRIPDRYATLLQSPALARLRNVRQLGFTLSRYPGAVHTRFEHTIGTFHVLERLLDQFGVDLEQTRQRYFLSALVSEIGIYPMSWSTRSIFARSEDAKAKFGNALYTRFLEHQLGISWDNISPYLKASSEQNEWFRSEPGMEDFQYLSPIKLASMIDYVLRDSYYSGRYSGAFDYRFFQTIGFDKSYEASRQMASSLKELHRAAHALNSIYGDRTRRFLTAILTRLATRLSEAGHLDVETLHDPGTFVELDDDVFFALMGSAVEKAKSAGDDLAERMFDIVNQTRFVDIEIVDRDPVAGSLSREGYESEIAAKRGIPADSVFCLGDGLTDGIGFRLFGTEFRNYDEAVSSEHFRKHTGLIEPDDRTGLENPAIVSYVVV